MVSATAVFIGSQNSLILVFASGSRAVNRENLLALMLHDPASVDDLALHVHAINGARARLDAVSLVLPRPIQVTVIRQPSAERKGKPQRPAVTIAELPADQNDVINALARSGGVLSVASILIIRHGPDGVARDIRIPMSMPATGPLPFKPEEVIRAKGVIILADFRLDTGTITGTPAVEANAWFDDEGRWRDQIRRNTICL